MDYKNIMYFTIIQQLFKHQVRYFEFLVEFNYKIVYYKRTENSQADALNRRPDYIREIPDITTQAL